MKKPPALPDSSMAMRLLGRIGTLETRLKGHETEMKKLVDSIGGLTWDLRAAKEMLHRLMRSDGG